MNFEKKTHNNEKLFITLFATAATCSLLTDASADKQLIISHDDVV